MDWGPYYATHTHTLSKVRGWPPALLFRHYCFLNPVVYHRPEGITPNAAKSTYVDVIHVCCDGKHATAVTLTHSVVRGSPHKLAAVSCPVPGDVMAVLARNTAVFSEAAERQSLFPEGCEQGLGLPAVHSS